MQETRKRWRNIEKWRIEPNWFKTKLPKKNLKPIRPAHVLGTWPPKPQVLDPLSSLRHSRLKRTPTPIFIFSLLTDPKTPKTLPHSRAIFLLLLLPIFLSSHSIWLSTTLNTTQPSTSSSPTTTIHALSPSAPSIATTNRTVEKRWRSGINRELRRKEMKLGINLGFSWNLLGLIEGSCQFQFEFFR